MQVSGVPDWYEPHYLSVCRGLWQQHSDGDVGKNKSSTACTAMNGGYKFYLPALLASDAGLPISGFLDWSFATIDTAAPFTLLVVGIAFLIVSMITYGYAAVTTPMLTPQTLLLWPRVGYLASIGAMVTLIISSAKITADMRRVTDNGVGNTWSTGGFYIWTWLATGLTCLAVVVAIVFAFRIAKVIRQPPKGNSLLSTEELRKSSW